eukprot:gene2845-5682_t
MLYLLLARFTTQDGLELPDGCCVTVVDQSDNGWTLVSLEGKTHWVPTSWLRPVDTPAQIQHNTDMLSQVDADAEIDRSHSTDFEEDASRIKQAEVEHTKHCDEHQSDPSGGVAHQKMAPGNGDEPYSQITIEETLIPQHEAVSSDSYLAYDCNDDTDDFDSADEPELSAGAVLAAMLPPPPSSSPPPPERNEVCHFHEQQILSSSEIMESLSPSPSPSPSSTNDKQPDVVSKTDTAFSLASFSELTLPPLPPPPPPPPSQQTGEDSPSHSDVSQEEMLQSMRRISADLSGTGANYDSTDNSYIDKRHSVAVMQAPRRRAPPPPSSQQLQQMSECRSSSYSPHKRQPRERIRTSEGNSRKRYWRSSIIRLEASGPVISRDGCIDNNHLSSVPNASLHKRKSSFETRMLITKDRVARLADDLLHLRPQLRSSQGPTVGGSSLILLHHGELMKISKGKAQCRYFFLFDKLLVYCKREKGKLEVKGTLETRGMNVRDCPDGTITHDGSKLNHAWQINNIMKSKWYTLYGTTFEEKHAWLRAFSLERDYVNPLDHKAFIVQVTHTEIARSRSGEFGFELEQRREQSTQRCIVRNVVDSTLCPGMQVGDFIILVNGIRVESLELEDIVKILYLMTPKSKIDCVVQHPDP